METKEYVHISDPSITNTYSLMETDESVSFSARPEKSRIFYSPFRVCKKFNPVEIVIFSLLRLRSIVACLKGMAPHPL